MKKSIAVLVTLFMTVTMLVTACAPAAPAATAEPQVVIQTQVVVQTQAVVQTQVVEKTVVVQEPAAPDEMATAKAFLAGKKICAVLPGTVNDGGWNQVAYMGLINLRDNFGMEMLYRESTKPEDAAGVLRSYADAGCSIIQAHGSEFSDQINQVAKEYPNVQFMQLSRCAGQEPNLIGLCYSTGEGGYFMGLLAGQITKTGKIAYVVGTMYPNLDWNPTMSKQAVKDLKDAGVIKMDVTVEEKEVGSWDDAAKAKELTTALIAQGYDVILGIADAADAGSIQAVKEARAAGKDVMYISWSADKNYLGQDFVIGGWKEHSDLQMQYAAVQYALAGKPIGKGFPLGIKEGAVTLSPMYGLVSTEIEKYVVDAYQKYVKEGPSAFPTLQVRTDL